MRVGIVSLGCCRNLVDSEILLGRLNRKGFDIVDIDKSDIAIVNTCSFIKEATEESLDVILELLELKKKGKLKKIIVAGCLAQRYKQQLFSSLKGIDAFIGRLSLDSSQNFSPYKLTPKHFSYVKICEGCINACSYCVIPQIKGPLKSRAISSIVDEVKSKDQENVSEINLIGQDITSYGIDLYKRPELARLLKEILKNTRNFKWLRLIYTHPAHIDDKLIKLIRDEERIVKYIDLPVQHINDRILKAMNRKTTKKYLLSLIDKLRSQIPSIAIRTSLIVGFPGETDREFRELIDFIGEIKFDRLGVFIYSREENTPAYNFENQVPEKTKNEHFKILMQKQQEISETVNLKFMNKEIEVLIDCECVDTERSRSINANKLKSKKYNKVYDSVDKKINSTDNIYLGRTYADAPEVDGMVYVHAKRKLTPGDFVKVRIKDTFEYDLVGEQL